jgi:predicted O-methyltransferase YrrM
MVRIVPKNSDGLIVEIGCWEGRSSHRIANACYPQNLICVDTWEGNVDEGEPYSQLVAKQRDVHSTFLENMNELTQGNFKDFRMDCHEYLRGDRLYKFVHIDACHDYDSVKRTIEAILPRLVSGGVICGDDYLSASEERIDLNGGVMRAVKELLPHHFSLGNFWGFVNAK